MVISPSFSCIMDQEAYQRAQALGLCVRCLCLFINPKYEDILLKEEDVVRQYVTNKLSLQALPEPPEDHVCPCCMNCLTKVQQITEVIDKLVGEAHSNAHNQTIFLNIITPPVLETVRIACRTVVTTSPVKLCPFPCWDELLGRLLGKMLAEKHKICHNIEEAKVKVDVVVNFHDEINLAFAIDPKFQKSKKRKLQGVQLQVADHSFAFERRDEDMKLLQYLSGRLKTYCSELLPPVPPPCPVVPPQCALVSAGCPLSWRMAVCTQPIYLIGRYRKLSREISQAKWTLTEENEDYEEEYSADNEARDLNTNSDNNTGNHENKTGCNANEGNSSSNTTSKLKSVRKGKMSVEEIVCEAVNLAMKAKLSRLHPCGREDIDVRMLGNGRPFVVEVLEAKEPPSGEVLQQALDFINSGRGLNEDQDVGVLILEETTHQTWATMQHAAEEKRKGYSCICWSANTLTREIIENIESVPQTCGNVDNEGIPCLEITQKTPLRVLHRRSALTRTRHIYSLSAARLNDHYFVLHLTTSAGAYVKEFVHGDLGRTSPSIASLVSSPTDILQLDVTWLYDSFVGNGNEPPSVPQTRQLKEARVATACEDDKGPSPVLTVAGVGVGAGAGAGAVVSTQPYKVSELAHANLSWKSLQQMPLASFASNATLSIVTPVQSFVRYCILGTSFISGVMVEAIRRSKDGEIYCVCGRTAGTLAAFAEKYQIPVTYSDYSLMLQDPLVEVVYIGLPTALHADWVIRCAQAGKHILNEKAFALTALDTRRALQVVEEQGVFCMEAQMFRCHPILSRLATLVHSELPMGAVLSVQATFTADIINLFNRKAGGSILDLGCYPMSLLRFLFGEPIAITATASLVAPEKEGDNVFDSATTADIEMASGLRAVIHTANNKAHNWEFHIMCEHGKISLSDLWREDVADTITMTSSGGRRGEDGVHTPATGTISADTCTVNVITVTPPQNFYTLQIETVNRHVRNSDVQASSPAMSWDDSINNMAALDMWRQAIKLRYPGYE